MNQFFNNHDLTFDNPIVSAFNSYLMDYPTPFPESDDDYSLSCYIEEYPTPNGIAARLKDKSSGKKIEFWTSPNDPNAIEQKRGLLLFLSETKRMNNPDYFKKDGKAYILIQGILLKEKVDTIELASYFAELFYAE